MEPLVVSLQTLLAAGWDVVINLLAVLIPWTPLVAWVAFWLLAVNWEKLYPVMAKRRELTSIGISTAWHLLSQSGFPAEFAASRPAFHEYKNHWYAKIENGTNHAHS